MSKHALRATIHDVAKKAGVSSATASRVLSGANYPVSDSARTRIIQAAKLLNYRTDAIGQIKQTHPSQEIGLILPNISNPFYAELYNGIETASKQYGFQISLCNSLRNEQREREYFEALCQRRVAGIILCTVTTNIAPLKKLKNEYNPHIVTLEQPIPELTIDHINLQNRRAAKEATAFLIQNGHKCIALISGALQNHSRKEFLRGYRDGLSAAKIEHNQSLELFPNTENELLNGDIFEFENGKLLAAKMCSINPRPTAALCINDITAAAVIQKLHELKISVPDQISVMGLGNSAISRITSPELTTVNQSPFETGSRTVSMLINLITSGDTTHDTISIEPHIIVRGSVKKLN